MDKLNEKFKNLKTGESELVKVIDSGDLVLDFKQSPNKSITQGNAQ